MGILSSIFKKIFPSADAEPTTQTGNQPGAAQEAAPAAAAVAIDQVNVEALLNDKAENNLQKLNWRTSIVDLLKLLDLDSSLASRKELAKELDYTGDMNDSASMNIWLHRQVMNKLADNGGNVPADLKD
jgi:di/tripeptidase